jgi:predicted nucleic acid-binding protein
VFVALDTNFIAYAEGVLSAAADQAKHELSVRLVAAMAQETIVVARQALAEFHSLLVRKERLTARAASERIGVWAMRSRLVDTDQAVFEAALDLAAAHNLQIFDAIILAAAAEARCDLLLSEDLQNGFAWRGVVVTNPFGLSPDARVQRLLARA